MRASATALWLGAFAASAVGCYFEVAPVDLPLDLGPPDLVSDLPAPDVGADGPRCPGGALPLHSGELSDPPIEGWGAEPLEPINVGAPTTTVVLDTGRVAAGSGSLRLDTQNGQAGLFYPKTRDAHLDFTPALYVSFAITADNAAPANDPGWQGAQPHLLLVADKDNYIELVPEGDKLPRSPGAFLNVTVPLAGGNGWIRNRFGDPDLTNVRYLALVFDSWGAGFTVWVDDLRIGPGTVLDCPP